MENQEIALSVTDLHIKYRNLQKTSIKRLLKKNKKKKDKFFEAVKGVSFSVPKGKIIGIIGKNGSGKSTTLRAIAGIFSPDGGTIDLKGNSVSLLSIGVGFQPKLSGYENIFLSGMLLGFSEKEIESKVQEIIDFSGLKDAIYKPVNSYSSGMHSKLAFSITAFLETDILLIDEVFSVGDIKFKEKSYNKMKELISSKDRTVLIVSHNMKQLEDLCDEIIWMNDGLIVQQGEPAPILAAYTEFMNNLD